MQTGKSYFEVRGVTEGLERYAGKSDRGKTEITRGPDGKWGRASKAVGRRNQTDMKIAQPSGTKITQE
jgi:hypothetical protein